jgi:imidazolonepropionase-like amidohydrolase
MAILFLDGLVIDGNGWLTERGAVLVDGDHIVATGTSAQLEARRQDPDTMTVDLRGRALLPGLVDVHLHLAGGDFASDQQTISVGLAALRTAQVATRTLMAGITTVRAAGSRDYLDLDLRDAVREGTVIGPRVLASGRGLTTTGGHYHNYCAVEVDGIDAVRREVRAQIKRGVDSIKLMLSPGVATQGADVNSEQFSLEEVRVAVYEAHKVGRPVLTHAIGIGGIRNGVAAGVDSIDHGHYLDEEQALLMKQKGIYWVPTLSPMYYYLQIRQAEPWRIARAEAVQTVHERAFRMALDLGVPMAMGCDCGGQSRMPNGANALELELMVARGMSPMRAIVTATRESATLTRLINRVGTISPGKLADLIVVDGSPLDDITRLRTGVRIVVQGGVIRRNDLDTPI